MFKSPPTVCQTFTLQKQTEAKPRDQNWPRNDAMDPKQVNDSEQR